MSEKTCLYTVILPVSGAAVLQVRAPLGLTDDEAIEVAIDNACEATLRVETGGSLCEIQDWEMHTEPVNRGNVCHFAHTTPVVEVEDAQS